MSSDASPVVAASSSSAPRQCIYAPPAAGRPLRVFVPAQSLCDPALRFTLPQAVHIVRLAHRSEGLHVCSRHAPATAAASDADASSSQPAASLSLSVRCADAASGAVAALSLISSDALGVVFSFLPAVDFLSAVAVSRRWHALRSRPAAWPAMLHLCPCTAGKLATALAHALDPLDSNDVPLLRRTTNAFRQLTLRMNSDECLAAMLATDIAPRLVQLLSHADVGGVVFNCVAVLVDVLSSDDEATQEIVLDAGVVPALGALLNSTNLMQVLRLCVVALRNVTAGTQEQIELVLSSPSLVETLVFFACSGADPENSELANEATFALCNAITGGSSKQVHLVLQQDVLRAHCAPGGQGDAGASGDCAALSAGVKGPVPCASGAARPGARLHSNCAHDVDPSGHCAGGPARPRE
jgi:hypothetical protein